ncbi:MAG: hypothetical protein MPJ50_12030 [Pirellulales bacterium]|nr:hypothetical protein [Pirellulales bacterium]
MNDNANSKAKSSDQRNQKPLKVIRVGAIAASIWRRQTPTGFEYLDFSLSRSWKLKSGEKEGYSQNFFENNEEALVEVIAEASRFIREHELHANVSAQARNGAEAPSAAA